MKKGVKEEMMITREIIFFKEPGANNTQATLEAVRERVKLLGIKKIVLATNSGDTALKAVNLLKGLDAKIIAVTLHAGTWKAYREPDPEKVREAENLGVKFLTATHTLMGNVGSAIKEKFGGLPDTELIAYALYCFSQGMKVAVEITVMAADAGLISSEKEVIAVGGTNQGADTAIVLKPAYSTSFFDLKVREIIAMPR